MHPTMRRATPESEAVVSSEDERPWPSAPSFGTLPRKENGVPGLGGGIWSQKRGSFKMEKAAQRNAAREARLGAPNQPRSGWRGESTPSPAASDGSGAFPFTIPLQPTPKVGRSASHSQGQREVPQNSGTHPSSNDHAQVLPLGLLAEEVDTETDSELGGALTHTASQPPIGTLQRISTLPSTYESFYAGRSSKEPGEASAGAQPGSRGDQKFEGSFANTSLEHPQRRSQWQTHLGWDDVLNVNESRRHSLADIPTRRGSAAGAGENRGPMGGGAFWPDRRAYDWEDGPLSHQEQAYRDTRDLLEFGAVITGPNGYQEAAKRAESLSKMKASDKDEYGNVFEIPNMYRVPYIKIAEHERSEQDKRGPMAMGNVGPWNAMPNRPRKQLFIVSFKCSRVDVFYLLDNTGLAIKAGDIVIVEADRGQDLGTVQHSNVTPDDARLYKRKYGEEQYKWLMMFSKSNQPGSVNPNAQVYGENQSGNRSSSLIANAPATMQGLPRDNFNNLKPKAIKRLASNHEIRMLAEKEGNEAKAKRTCQQKVQHLHLDMEILDAEWQWDFQKLIFYYYADHYINFKDLITELYRIYKTRIWLSAINPASFSQHALGQPPSGIGPGAIGGFNPGLNNSYTMMYGPDPDPYGAIPPYRIGYDTYTPNYPGIPGVANSFAPMGMENAYQQNYGGGSGDATPSVPPGVTPTGTAADYNYYYDRNAANRAANAPKPFNALQGTYPGAPLSMDGFPMYGGPGGMPPTSTDRGAYGPSFNGFNNSPNTQEMNSVAGGLGRLAAPPAPIGTGPPSNGNPTQTPTAPPTQGTSADYMNFSRLSISNESQHARVPHLPGLSMPGMTGPRGSGVTPLATQFDPWAASFTGAQEPGKSDIMKNYIYGKQSARDRHADEMSRER